MKKTLIILLALLWTCPAFAQQDQKTVIENLKKEKLIADIDKLHNLSERDRKELKESVQNMSSNQVEKLDNVTEEEKEQALEMMRQKEKMMQEAAASAQNENAPDQAPQPEAVPAAQPSEQPAVQAEAPEEKTLHPNWDTLPESQKKALQSWQEQQQKQQEKLRQYQEQVQHKSLPEDYFAKQ